MDNDISIATVERLLAKRGGISPDEDCPDTEAIALALADGMSPEQVMGAFPHVASCAICREAVQIFGETAQPEKTGEVLLLPQRNRHLSWGLLAAAILLTGALAGGGLSLWRATQNFGEATTLTPKGGVFDLEIAVSRNGQRFALLPGDEVETGDRLGFFYTAPIKGELALFHVNEAKEISVLYPNSAQYTAPVEAGARIPIQDGALVTSATSCEWIVAVFSGESLSIDGLKSQLEKMLQIDSDCHLQAPRMHQLNIKIQQIRKRGG